MIQYLSFQAAVLIQMGTGISGDLMTAKWLIYAPEHNQTDILNAIGDAISDVAILVHAMEDITIPEVIKVKP